MIAVVGFITAVTGGVFAFPLIKSERPVVDSTSQKTQEEDSPSVLGAQATQEVDADKLYGLINGYRREQGKAVLRAHQSLEKSAQYKLSDMIAKKYWRHENQDNQAPWQFFTKAGYAYVRAGENLAFGTSSAWGTLEKWQQSPLHDAQLLEDSYQDMGLAIDCNSYDEYTGNTCIVVLHLGASR